MPLYTWKNKKTGKLVDVRRSSAESSVPPDIFDDLPGTTPGDWERYYAFGIGRVEGAGGSPARTTKAKKK